MPEHPYRPLPPPPTAPRTRWARRLAVWAFVALVALPSILLFVALVMGLLDLVLGLARFALVLLAVLTT